MCPLQPNNNSRRSIRIKVRRSLFYVVSVAFLAACVLGLSSLTMSGPLTEAVRVALISSVAGLLVGLVLLLVEVGISELQERRRKKQELEKEIRKKILEPAKRELTPQDIGASYLKGNGPPTLPAESNGGGDAGGGVIDGGDLPGGGEWWS
jgi:hypothetical protein